ncbi:MAG: hypothetical protein PHI11_10485 [Gallionella sp.]|nr:hypothetical protein [Gallionella sp.]
MLKLLSSLAVFTVVILFTPFFGFRDLMPEFMTSLYLGDWAHAKVMVTGEKDHSQFAQIKQGVVLPKKSAEVPQTPPPHPADKDIKP